MRAETPDAWFTNSLARAANATSSTSSRNQSGMTSSIPQYPGGPRLLRGDPHGRLPVLRVVGDDLRVDPVLQRRDDVAPVGVVLGVGRIDHHNVQLHPDGETPDLDVLFFHNIQQTDLDSGAEGREAR